MSNTAELFGKVAESLAEGALTVCRFAGDVAVAVVENDYEGTSNEGAPEGGQSGVDATIGEP